MTPSVMDQAPRAATPALGSSAIAQPTSPEGHAQAGTAQPERSSPACPASPARPTPAARAATSRRAFFRPAAAALAGFWGAETVTPPPARAAGPAASADVDPAAVLSKLVRRVTMGYTPEEMALAQNLGYQGYLEYHLNHTAIDDAALSPRLAGLDTLPMSSREIFVAYNSNASAVSNQLIEAVILRAVYSKRQLFERMVEFWTDHFNIDILNGNDQFLKTTDDRDVIRANALGKFPDLLRATAMSPAMLLYLDNATSSRLAPNENYARELLELHTLGVDAGYTQADVINVARVFTGWSFQGLNTTNPLAGTFVFNSGDHDTLQKTVLGFVIAGRSGPSAIEEGFEVLRILADLPATASFVGRKLARWLLREDPPQRVVDAVAAAYTATGGDIKAMIRAALAPNVVADAPPKFKRPFHLFVSALRALNASVTSTSTLRNTHLRGTGHIPFQWGPPDGYPDTVNYWGGLVLPRWNFGASLMTTSNGNTGSLSGVVVDDLPIFSGLTTADQMADKLNLVLCAGEMTPAERNRLRDYLLPNPPTRARQREAIGLGIASPSFQWY